MSNSGAVYHVNAETGRPNICRAESPSSCPVGGQHFGDKSEAKQHGEKLMEQQHGATKTHQVLKKSPKPTSDNNANESAAGTISNSSPTSGGATEENFDDLESENSGKETTNEDNIVEPVEINDDDYSPEEKASIKAIASSPQVFNSAQFERSYNSSLTAEVDEDGPAGTYDSFSTSADDYADYSGDSDDEPLYTGDVIVDEDHLVDSFYNRVKSPDKKVNLAQEQKAKETIRRVLESHDLLSSYNYSPKIQFDGYQDSLSGFECHVSSDGAMNELKSMFSS